jgi:hypothetical protein
MNRILRGAVFLAVTAALGACGTEPDQFADGTPDHIVAEPGVVFIARADSQNVRVRIVDQQGTALLMPISVTNVGPGINVRADSAFRPIYHGDTLVFNPNTTELRLWVSTSALDNSSFTVNAGNLSLDIPVVVTPADDESLPFSTLTPALGEVVTVTASSAMLFTDSTKVVFGSTTLTPIEVAADGKSLQFNAAPDLLGPATFTNVTLDYNKHVVFSVAASDTMNSPSSVQEFAFTKLDPGIGEAVTVTAPAGVHFTEDTKISFDSAGPDAHFTLIGDGSSISMTAGPGSVGPTTFSNMVRPDNPTFTFTLKSTDTLESAGVSTFLATADKASAAANEPVTFTGGPAYQFDIFNSTLLVNGKTTLISSVSADSTQAVVLPMPGSTGGASTINGPVVAGFLLGSLPISGAGPTVAALASTTAGTDAFATAPTLNAPGVGEAVAFWNGAPFGFTGHNGDLFGNGGTQLFKLVVPADGSFHFALPYISDGADLGIYFFNSSEGFISSLGVDDAGGGSGDAEAGDVDLAAGTYYVAIVYFQYGSSPTAPALYGFSLTGIQPEE